MSLRALHRTLLKLTSEHPLWKPRAGTKPVLVPSSCPAQACEASAHCKANRPPADTGRPVGREGSSPHRAEDVRVLGRTRPPCSQSQMSKNTTRPPSPLLKNVSTWHQGLPTRVPAVLFWLLQLETQLINSGSSWERCPTALSPLAAPPQGSQAGGCQRRQTIPSRMQSAGFRPSKGLGTRDACSVVCCTVPREPAETLQWLGALWRLSPCAGLKTGRTPCRGAPREGRAARSSQQRREEGQGARGGCSGSGGDGYQGGSRVSSQALGDSRSPRHIHRQG